MSKASSKSLSIRNSIVEGELEKEATVRNFRTVQTEGNRFNLNIPRYIDTFEEEGEITKLEKELMQVRGEMDKLPKGIER